MKNIEKSNVGVACVGAGYFAQYHIESWNRIDEVDLLAGYDHDLQKVKLLGLTAYTELTGMLSELPIDILDIITPPTSHLELIRHALNAEIPLVVCQKPFCNSLDEAKLAIEESLRAGTQLVVHDNFRFQPWFRTIKQSLDREELGHVQQATFRMRPGDGQGPEAYLDRQPYFQTMNRFLVHETAIHYVDTFRYLFGEPTSVYADLRKLNPVIAGEDAGIILFDFPDQLSVLYDGNRHLDFEAENKRLTFGEALIEGTEASLLLAGDGRVVKRAFDCTD
nr:Gfo/Idh/MocA family oxidoreductase [Granulosicoccus sp.]